MTSCTVPLRIARPRPICRLCDHVLRQPPACRRSLWAQSTTTFSTFKAPAIRWQPARQNGPLPKISMRRMATAVESKEKELEANSQQSFSERIGSLKAKLAQVEEHIKWLYSSNTIEPEIAVLQPLVDLEFIAKQAISIRARQPLPPKITVRQSSAGAILSLNGDDNAPPSNPYKLHPKSYSIEDLPAPTYLSGLAQNLLRHKKVFISPAVLAKYVDLQCLLGCPRTIPEIFHLYAHKPVPQLGSSPPKYSKPSPKAAKQAIPVETADKALEAAIDVKDMALALDVVETSYRAPAWYRRTVLKKVVPPGIVIAMLPFAIYMIAAELSVYSNYINPWTYKWYAFAGFSTYFLCTGTLGFVALATHNDHFVRVVWMPGVPLIHRWLREDERAALDKIACAWGFKEDWKRGDEEGEDWEGLKEWVLLREMVLDKPDLMPGMNA